MSKGMMYPLVVPTEGWHPWAIFFREKIQFFYRNIGCPGSVDEFEVDCDVLEVYRLIQAGRRNIILRTPSLQVDHVEWSYVGGGDYHIPPERRNVNFTLMLGDTQKSFDIPLPAFNRIAEELLK